MKRKKILMVTFFVLMGISTFASLEEINFVEPKIQTLNKQLVKSENLLSVGADFIKVKNDYEKLAKSVGMDDVTVSIEGNNLYGSVITMNISGNVESSTISRRLLNKTKVPYKVKMELLVGKFH